MPIANPELLPNHLLMITTPGGKQKACPNPSVNPNVMYSCHISVTVALNISPAPAMTEPTNTVHLQPQYTDHSAWSLWVREGYL